jgi:hypothetical protein
VKSGIYQHFKGGRYRVIGVALHEETLEELVVYESLDPNPVSKLWARPLSVFQESVTIDGKQVPRFQFIAEAV